MYKLKHIIITIK